MSRDIHELKQAVESTNASLKQVIERFDASNARLDATNADLGTTNSKLGRTMITVAQLVGSMADMKQYLTDNMATKKDMSDLNSRMDGFSGLLLDSRHRWAIHADTLYTHDERLKKLETPTPQ
jgi:hypothetical protein